MAEVGLGRARGEALGRELGQARGTTRVEQIMGTAIGLDLRDAIDPAVVDAAFDLLRDVDARFSTYRPQSEISRLGRGEMTAADCSPDVREVLALCERVRVESGGAFDIRAAAAVAGRQTAAGDDDASGTGDPGEARDQPGRNAAPPTDERQPLALDPSGLVKGWALERVAAILEAGGARNFSLNAGGDIVVRGLADGRPWRIGIRHPEVADRVAAVIAVSDLAVATSGLYERGDHIVDPSTGRSPRELRSVTVIGPSLTFADAYATAALVMGIAGLRWVASLPGYGACGIAADDRLISTPEFDRVRAPVDAPPIAGAASR